MKTDPASKALECRLESRGDGWHQVFPQSAWLPGKAELLLKELVEASGRSWVVAAVSFDTNMVSA